MASDTYAVIETGGKQYRVKPNDMIEVERLETPVGEKLAFENVLAVRDGNTLTIGTPSLKGVTVTSLVLEHIRGKKLISFKKKRRKGYSRKQGHRQELTILKIETIS